MVFGSHRPKPGEPEYEEAEALGRALAEAGFDVASGGYGGIMEAVLKGPRQLGREGIGYTARIYASGPNKYVSLEISSADLFERISRMLEQNSGFVFLKGGTGTLLELAACWEMVNKKLIPHKPIVCLGDFWLPVVEALTAEASVENVETLKPLSITAAHYIRFANTVAEVVDTLNNEIRRD